MFGISVLLNTPSVLRPHKGITPSKPMVQPGLWDRLVAAVKSFFLGLSTRSAVESVRTGKPVAQVRLQKDALGAPILEGFSEARELMDSLDERHAVLRNAPGARAAWLEKNHVEICLLQGLITWNFDCDKSLYNRLVSAESCWQEGNAEEINSRLQKKYRELLDYRKQRQEERKQLHEVINDAPGKRAEWLEKYQEQICEGPIDEDLYKRLTSVNLIWQGSTADEINTRLKTHYAQLTKSKEAALALKASLPNGAQPVLEKTQGEATAGLTEDQLLHRTITISTTQTNWKKTLQDWEKIPNKNGINNPF